MLLRLRFLLWVLTGLFFFSASPAFSQFANEEAVKKQADKYFDDEEYESCYKLYTQLVSLHQKDPELNYKLGVCMLFMEPNKKKCYPYLELANKSLKDCPKEARFYLGKAYHLNFKFDEAMKNYAQYKDMGSVAMVKKLQVDQEIEACKNGKRLLSNLTELIVSEKKLLSRADYFRSYNLSDIGGKLLVKPLEFISVLDKKKKNQSIIYLPKSNDQLYYASYGENPDNGKDLFVVKKLPDGEWSKPQNIGSPINTPFDEDYPFLHPNGKVLYFASKGHNSMGGYDIFKSELDEATGKWKAPVNMDFPINTPDDDILFVTDSLEKTAYFSSARSSPIGKIDVYKINTERRPMDFAYIKGTVVKKQPEQSILSKISIKNVDNGEDIGNYAANDSGQYSLQLPNGGKLLFTVETPGFTTQSEGVNLPQATTLKPYRQLIYYENKKLVIQNLFDQNINSDDAYLQYLDLIEQKSKLDVNADDFPVANNNTPVAANNTVKNNTDTSKTGSAKNTLNNEDLVKMAYKDAGELESESAQLKSEAGDAFTFANNKNVEAENKNKAATQAMEKANTEPDAKIKEQFVAEANKLKEEAETSSKNALLANNIAKQLEVDASNKKKEADLTLNYAKQLEEANKAKNNKEVLAKLESVQKELEDLSKTNTTNTNSLTNSIKVEAERKQEELKKAQAAIDKLKKDQENNTKEIAAIDKEIASTSDKDLIANYKAQQEDLKADVESSKKEITNTENKVAVLKKETELLQSQADFVSTMLTTVKGETAVATNNTTAKDPLNTTNNNTTTTNNNTGKDPLNNTATTTANNTSTKDYAAENKQLDQQLTALNSAPETADNYNKKNEILNNYINNINKEIASQKETLAKTQQAGEKNVINNNIKSLEQQKNQKSAELIKNTDKLAGIGNTTNTTVATNNTTTKDTANKTNTAVPANYTAASKQYDQELTALNNAPETADKYNKQNEIINNYIKSIDKEIAIQQETLAKTQQPGEKTVINNNIKNLEQQKNQKSAELIRNTDKLASIGTSTNTNVASNNNTTKDTANKTSATVPANYTDASKQYDQQLAALNNTTETTDTYTKKNEVLNNYVKSIDKEITTQQEALTKTDKQSEKTAISNNIKNLEQQKTEKSNEIAANNTKLSSLNNTTNNTVANNNVTANDTANKTNTAVPANYTDASKQYDQQLAALNNTTETTDTYTKKNEVLNKYIKSIDKEITTQQEALTKTDKQSEKTAIANNIKNLEQQKTEKSNEIAANNTKLSSLNNTTNNTVANNTVTANDTANKTNTAVPANYTDASKQYDQQLAALNNTAETTDTYTKKNEVLNNYVESIDKEITTQQEALTKTDKQSEKTAIANNIKNLEQQKTEKSNEIAANNTKLSSLNNTTNNIVANNTVTTNDTANKTNTAVPANYTDASKQYDQQLAALNNTAETTDTYTRKNEVLNNYVKSIDKEISTQQEALTKAQKKSEKTAIANNIKNLEQQKTEKSNEIIANNTKLASLNNTTNNTLTTNNTTTKDTLTNTALATNNTASKDSSNKNSAQSAAEHEQLLQEINGIKNSNSLTFNKDESLFFTNVVYNDQQALSIKQQVDEKLARLKTVENTVGQKINQLENSIKNGSSANSTDQSIHDLSKRADQLNDEALELRKASASYSGTQKEEAIAKIASLEKEAEDLRLKSVEDQWSLYQQQYATNNMNLNTLSGLSEKNQHEDIVQANLLAGDSKTFQAQADKMRGDSKAESSTASKTAALTNANDKLLVAITKQNQSIELYKKHNPGFQPAANTAVASNHKAEVEEIKKQIADGVVIKHDILKTLSDANKAEYNALLAKLNQLEKTNPGANPEAKNLKAAAQKNLIEANALLIKVNNTTNEVEKKGFYVDANKYLSEGINNLNKAIALVQPAVVTNVNTNNNETKTETKTVLVDPVTTNTTNTTAPVKDKNEPTPEQLAKLKNTPQYKTYQNLKTEADKLNVVAETENVKAQEYYDIAIKHLKESTDLRIKADTLPEGTEKDQIQRNAIELDRIANINKAKGDSLHELSNNTKAFAASKIEEANAIIGPLAKNNTTSAVVVANNNVKENNNTANSNTASSNKSNTENYIKGKGFEITKGNAYSDAKPVPMDEKLPDGLIFRVQIGAFKKALPNESFKGLSPVGGERTASGLIRYQVGLFDQFDNANAVKNDMKGIGYKDAFVVAYKDGKRINMNDAFNELKNQGIAVNPSNNSTAGIKNNANVPVAASGEATATNSNPVNVTSELSSMQGMLFTVQIGVYNSQLKSSQLNNLEPIYREKLSGGLYRYTAGVYSNIDRVKADKAKVNALGMRDAFVSAYFNGEKIKINEALSKINSGEKLSFPAENPIRFNGQAAVLPESSPLNPTSNTNPVATAVSPFSNGVSEGPAPTAENGVKVGEEGISYKVQIGAYRNQVPQNVAGNFMKIKTWPIKYLRVNDLFVYTIGSFTDVKNAKKLQQEAVSNGITDAFITVFKDGKKLFGTEAGKYLNQ